MSKKSQKYIQLRLKNHDKPYLAEWYPGAAYDFCTKKWVNLKLIFANERLWYVFETADIENFEIIHK